MFRYAKDRQDLRTAKENKQEERREGEGIYHTAQIPSCVGSVGIII